MTVFAAIGFAVNLSDGPENPEEPDDVGVITSADDFKRLRENTTSVVLHNISDEVLALLESHRTISQVTIVETPSPPLTLERAVVVIQKPGLQKLTIFGCQNLPPQAAASITRAAALRDLSLHRSIWSDKEFSSLAESKSIRSLSLNNCPELSDVGLSSICSVLPLTSLALVRVPNITGQLFVADACLSSLEAIYCNRLANLTDHFFDVWIGCKQLRTIIIDGCPKVGDECGRAIGRIGSLRLFAVQGTGMTRGIVNCFASLKLTSLSLDAPLGSREISAIGSLTSLEELAVAISEDADNELLSLSALKKLRTLTILSAQTFSDRHVGSLAKLAAEEIVLLDCPQVSDRAIAQFNAEFAPKKVRKGMS